MLYMRQNMGNKNNIKMLKLNNIGEIYMIS